MQGLPKGNSRKAALLVREADVQILPQLPLTEHHQNQQSAPSAWIPVTGRESVAPRSSTAKTVLVSEDIRLTTRVGATLVIGGSDG